VATAEGEQHCADVHQRLSAQRRVQLEGHRERLLNSLK
jgi:hypothetical protein